MLCKLSLYFDQSPNSPAHAMMTTTSEISDPGTRRIESRSEPGPGIGGTSIGNRSVSAAIGVGGRRFSSSRSTWSSLI
jgi:hypothetical protein